MVFPRNAGFGRCYLVSTRHEILSNIDQNIVTGTQLRLRKKRNQRNPARVQIPSVLLLYFESQTVVFQIFDFHLRKFKKFIVKKFYFHNHMPKIGAKSKIFQLRIISVNDSGGSRIKRYTVGICILSRIRSIFRIYKP